MSFPRDADPAHHASRGADCQWSGDAKYVIVAGNAYLGDKVEPELRNAACRAARR